MSTTVLEPTAANTSAKRTAPRGLLFFLSHQDSYRRPLFSRQDVFCGPDTDARVAGNRVFALKTPVGSFDAAEIARQLPAEQTPEFVLVKADATGRNFPRNLGALPGPKILLVGDTHHMSQPLTKVIAYAKSEPFDFVIFDHTRHHAHFFAEAGLKNLHWLPALDYGYNHRPISESPSRPLTFVGQVGRHHPWRRAVLDQVKAAGLPLEILKGTLAETADIYADSQVTLNVSLNGDLNLRVFESLAAGGFLLTDQLTEASGLPLLFEAGRHLDTWKTPGELVEKIRHYLANPAEARKIRAEGQAEIQRAHHPDVKIREFYDLVFSGKVNPRYDLGLDRRFVSASAAPDASSRLTRRLQAYEALQSLHQNAEVTVYCEQPAALADLADLPRLRFAPLAELDAATHDATAASTACPAARVLWTRATGTDFIGQVLRFTGNQVIAPEADGRTLGELAAWGFAPTSENSWVHALAQPGQFLRRAWDLNLKDTVRRRLAPAIAASRESEESLALAHYADELGENDLRRIALDQAVGLDRNNQSALLALAGISLEEGERGSTLMLLEEAARIAPLPAEVEALRASLEAQAERSDFAQPYYQIINRRPVASAATPRKILLVTNLFPPQELGGYGRMMWEFAHGLRARGHEVKVLAGNSPLLAKPPTLAESEMEKVVSRRLQLLGVWYDGRPFPVNKPKEIEARTKANSRLIRNTARAMNADVILAGNLDFIGAGPINETLDTGLPVLHALANAAPGFTVEEQPTSSRYWVAPCSGWNGSALRQGGYTPTRMETLYPGARVDNFFRFFLPDTRRLRICYASLVLPYKGAHTLIEALGHLHLRGVDFTAEIAGDAPDPDFAEKLRAFVQRNGMTDRVRFTGFLDRPGLAGLFARNNVLVFPSQFQEPFGISQVEAMAAGLAVVSSGTGGAREIVRDGTDGLLFPAGNALALADRLQSLATQPELFTKLQQGAQSRAMQFSVDRAVHRIEQLIGEMLASEQAAA